MNLNDLAEILRRNGVPNARVATTGGNCHSIVIELPDGGEVLVNDYNGPLSDGSERVDGIYAFWTNADGTNPRTELGDDGALFISDESDAEEFGEDGEWIGWDSMADALECAAVVRDSIADAFPGSLEPVAVTVRVEVTRGELARGFDGLADLAAAVQGRLFEIDTKDGGTVVPTVTVL